MIAEFAPMVTEGQQQCFYCGDLFPAPVILHHDHDECLRLEKALNYPKCPTCNRACTDHTGARQSDNICVQKWVCPEHGEFGSDKLPDWTGLNKHKWLAAHEASN